MSSTQSKCYKGNIMAMTYGQCQCNIESKTCERNSSSFWWIESCSVKDDKQILFYSASWWWQTARGASAWRTILRYCWRNLVPMEEVVRLWGDISNMARRNWCKLTKHQMPQSTTKYHAVIMARHFLPYRDALAPRGVPHFILLDNNCTHHTARLVTAYITQ